MAIGDNIKSARKAMGISQQRLAEQVGVSQQTIANYENNNTEPSREILQKIGAQLGVSELMLYFGTGAIDASDFDIYQTIGQIKSDLDLLQLEIQMAIENGEKSIVLVKDDSYYRVSFDLIDILLCSCRDAFNSGIIHWRNYAHSEKIKAKGNGEQD